MVAARTVPLPLIDDFETRSPFLAGDCEETAVRIDVPTRSGGLAFAQCVVLHNGTEVVDVRLPEGHMAYAEAAGIPYEAAAEWEGFLCTLARLAFARSGR